jgi:hypothetical protein
MLPEDMDLIGVTEMAEVEGVSKQAMSARMQTRLFIANVQIFETRRGRLVPRDQFDHYREVRKGLDEELSRKRATASFV